MIPESDVHIVTGEQGLSIATELLGYQQNADFWARVLFFAAALLLALAAMLRTWASAYLKSQIVYASDVKSASLAAGGPYGGCLGRVHGT